MSRLGRYPLVLLLLLTANSAFGAVFCVDTAEELQAALTTAAANGQDDEVRIVQGTYVGSFLYLGVEAHDLTVSGGFLPECVTQHLEDGNTLIGSFSGRPLSFTAKENAILLLEGLSVERSSSSDYGGGIFIAAEDGSEIRVSRNWIRLNTSALGGGGIAISSKSTYEFGLNTNIIMENNYFEDNISGSKFDDQIGGGGLFIKLPEALVHLKKNVFKGNIGKTTYRPSGIPRSSSPYGGGIFIWCSTIDVNENIFSNNTAEIPPDTYSSGGAFYIRSNIARILSNSIFGNIAKNASGGGFYQNILKFITLNS